MPFPDLSLFDLPELPDLSPEETGPDQPLDKPRGKTSPRFQGLVWTHAPATSSNRDSDYIVDPEEERRLVMAWQREGHRPSLNRLIGAHMRKMRKITSSLIAEVKRRDLADDVLGEVLLAFIGACSRWDPSAGTRLATFASYAMVGAGRTFLLGNTLPLAVGTSSDERRAIYGQSEMMTLFSREAGHPFSGSPDDIERMSLLVDIPPKALSRGLDVHRLRRVRLDDTLPDAQDPIPNDPRLREILLDCFQGLASKFSSRDMDIFHDCLAIEMGVSGLTPGNLAEAHELTPTRIGQIRRKIRTLLRERLRKRGISSLSDAL